MKKLVYMVVLLTLIDNPIAHAQKIRTLFYDDILYGKVKQVCQFDYTPSGSEIELKDTTWYDESGNVLEDHRRTMHGTFFKEKYINTSDSSGKKMEMVGNEKDQIFSLKFNSVGNLVEYDSYLKNGNIDFRSFYEYDERNNLKGFRNVDKNGSYNLKRTYKYDKDDTRIAGDTWGENDKFLYHTDFEYKNFDKAGNWTKRIAHYKFQNGKVEDRETIRLFVYY